MLPWRVQIQRMLEAIREDPGFRNRVLSVFVAMALLIGAFSTGLSVNVQFGRTGSDGSQDADVAGGAGTFSGGTAPATGDDGQPTPAEGSVPTDGAIGGDGGTGDLTAGGGAPAPADGGDGAGPAPGAAPAPGPQGEGAPATAASCEGARLTATDRGVTDKTIKLGFLIPNLNELQAAGFNVGLQGDWNKIIPAWINEVNERRGGMACRKVEYVKEVFDVLSVDDMIAKCKSMVNDHKVFGVMTPGGYDSVAQLCVAKDNKTPFINPEPEPEGWYEAAAPYLWNMLMTKDRMHRNHVRWLMENNQIKPGDPNAVTNPATRVGVVYHGIPNVAPSVENALLPELKKHQVKPVQIAKLSSDDEQALAQINQVVLQFRQNRVQYVFMPMNLIFKTQFLQAADAQGYYPKYTDSDHYFGCFDFTTATYPARSFEGTKCVSSLDVAGLTRDQANKQARDHPYGQYADKVYAASYPEGYNDGGRKDQEAADTQRALFMGLGSQILLFEQAADRVGPNLTRPAWGAAMGQTGAFHQIPTFHPLTFTAEKWDGADHIVAVEWRAAASNGYEERKFRRLGPPMKAYY